MNWLSAEIAVNVCYHLACKVGRNNRVKIEATSGRLILKMRT